MSYNVVEGSSSRLELHKHRIAPKCICGLKREQAIEEEVLQRESVLRRLLRRALGRWCRGGP